MNIEIERKYLLKAIPKGEPIETIEIFQWYLKNSEGKHNTKETIAY